MQAKKKLVKCKASQQLINNKLTYYFTNGLKKAKGTFVNNKMEGEWRYYTESGELWQIGYFKNNQKDGQWTRFDKNGDIERQENFIDGKAIKS